MATANEFTEKEEEKFNLIAEDEESDEEPIISFYDKSSLISPPKHSVIYPLKRAPLSLYYSFGYDCYKRGNIQMFDANTLVFASGNFVHFYNIETKEKTYLRSVDGVGIGHIALHPSTEFLVVAEKGFSPHIYVYECESLKICKVLRGGATFGYSFVSFNPSGKLLASVATDPDYTLTIWNWRSELIILRSRAFFNDVYVVAFSPFTPGFLSTGGIGHIKFWKMAKTFTGLKLQGDIGRFGRTEVSNIEGLMQFPDGKVLSGSEWGNLLLWDGGLIKVELCRRTGKTCHSSSVSQFVLEEGEILSVGSDGYIKVWQFELLDGADSINDDRGLFEVEPLNELYVGPDVHLMFVVQSLNPATPNAWFAQDRNGVIWNLDFSFTYASKQPERVLSFHSGAIRGMDVSPISHLVASAGIDGTVKLLDILTKETLAEKRFLSPATTLAWFPKDMHPKGNLISVGFADGTLRILSVEPGVSVLNEYIVELHLFMCRKPHTDQVTQIRFHLEYKLLITGSIDCTVFIFAWSNELTPIGFVSMPAAVTSIVCSPPKFSPKSIFATCSNGQMVRFDTPEITKRLHTIMAKKKTYSMDSECPSLKVHFTSIKSKLRRDERLVKLKQKREELARKREKMAKEAALSGEPQTQEEKEKEEKEKEKEKEEEEAEEEEIEDDEHLFVPSEPSSIILGFCSQKQHHFWVSVDGYDAGYLYEYDIILLPDDGTDRPKYSFSEKPISSFPLFNSEDSPLLSYAFSSDGLFVVFGLKNGIILLYKLTLPWGLSSISYHWSDHMHDCDTGAVYNLCFSHDNKFVISSGGDGNLFVFKFDVHDTTIDPNLVAPIPEESMTREEIINVIDITDPEHKSLEEEKSQMEYSKLMKLVERKKISLQHYIRQLQVGFLRIIDTNNSLPKQMQLKRQDMTVSANLRTELMNEMTWNENQTTAELAWDAEKSTLSFEKMRTRFKDDVKWAVLKIKSFKSSVTVVVSSYRLAHLESGVQSAMYTTDDDTKLRTKTSQRSDLMTAEEKLSRIQEVIQDVQGVKMGNAFGHLDRHVQYVLQRIEERKRKQIAREAEWDALKVRKPNTSKGNPMFQKMIEEAKNNLGDYSLKSSSDYVGSSHMRMTTKKKLKQLVTSIFMTFTYKEEFNSKILRLRNRKKEIINRIEWISRRLSTIQKTMQLSERRPIPTVPKMENFEIPEETLKMELEKLNAGIESGVEKTTSKLPAANKFRVSVVSALAPGRPRASVMVRGGIPPGLFSTGTSTQPTHSVDVEGMTSESDLHNALKAKSTSTPLEIRLYKINLLKNVHEQDALVDEANSLVNNFDQELDSLVEERNRLDVAIKQGEARQIVLYGELQLLAQFETEEEMLLTKMNQRTEEKLELQDKIQDLQRKIETKKRESERYHEQERLLLLDLQVMLGEHNKFGIFLTKVYKKRVKRPKKKEITGDEEGEEDEESTESDEDMDLTPEEDEDDEYVNDKECPEGCDCQLFENVLQLREKRLDIEELLIDAKRFTEALKKEIDALNKKLKNVELALKSLEADFKKVEQEKQGRLNELDITVPLKLSQVQYLEDGELPQDLNYCLVFPASRLKKLEIRIQELQQEKVLHRQKQKESKIHHSQLVKDCKLMDNKIDKLQKKCSELMIEKFGCIIDLDKLESNAVNRAVEEMKDKVKKLDQKLEKERYTWKKKTDKFEEELSQQVLHNTQRILGLNQALMELQRVDSLFTTRLKNLPRDVLPEQTSRAIEENRLEIIVRCQEEEINKLKDKLNLAKEKTYCPFLDLSDFVKRQQSRLVCTVPAVKQTERPGDGKKEEDELIKKCIRELLETDDFEDGDAVKKSKSDSSFDEELVPLKATISDSTRVSKDISSLIMDDSQLDDGAKLHSTVPYNIVSSSSNSEVDELPEDDFFNDWDNIM